MNTKEEMPAKPGNDLYTLLVYRLNRLKEIGYHPRFSGAVFISDKEVSCDCCDFPTHIKIWYEKDYPKNPDIGLCSKCSKIIEEV